MHIFSKVFSAETCSGYSLNTACFNVEVNPLEKGSYYSAVDVAELGPITLALVQNRSSIVMRKGEQATNPGERRHTLSYVVEGELMVSHSMGTTPLKRGQLILMDNSFSRKMFVYKSVQLLLVCVPHILLERLVPEVEDVLFQVLDDPFAGTPQSPFASLLSLWDHLRSGELEEFSESIGEEALKDIGAVIARHGTGRQLSRHALRLVARVRQYIEANLGDPAMSAESIAAEFRVSSRYLRSLFQDSERLSQYIQRRRIEECAKLLSSPEHRLASITEIAYQCGFNSSTHFARCFRSRFAETAREFRNRHLLMQNEGPAADERPRLRH